MRVVSKDRRYAATLATRGASGLELGGGETEWQGAASIRLPTSVSIAEI